ncbi:MAG: hypothetical protein O3C61_07105 [Proteobacteria bacterium]|jgi:hypothetical protein|nr:hypothetical protein [Pseudomonadota bacterium]
MTKETNENFSQEDVQLSKEELNKRRAEITAYYKDHIKDLKVQKEYEELLRDIEKTRAERVQAQMYLAQIMAGPETGSPEEINNARNEAVKQAAEDWNAEQNIAPPKRTLKRAD